MLFLIAPKRGSSCFYILIFGKSDACVLKKLLLKKSFKKAVSHFFKIFPTTSKSEETSSIEKYYEIHVQQLRTLHAFFLIRTILR